MRRRFAQSFSAAYPHPWLLVLILALAVALTAVGVWRGFPSYPPAKTDALHALLAGLPAALGTLFVLAFTFTLVTGQIASNYSRTLFNRILNQYQGGMCISGVLKTTERIPRHLTSPLGPKWVAPDSAVWRYVHFTLALV